MKTADRSQDEFLHNEDGAQVDLDSYIHLIFERYPFRRLVRVTVDDSEAVSALGKGFDVANHQPVSALFLLLKGTRLPEVLDDKTWREVVAPALKAVGDCYEVKPDARAMWGGIPIDLPAPFADKRLQLLMGDCRPEDLASIVELTEIVMAVGNGRSPNINLFRELSRSLSWRQGPGRDEEELQRAMRYNLELQDKYFGLLGAAADPDEKHLAQRICHRLEAEQRELVITVGGANS